MTASSIQRLPVIQETSHLPESHAKRALEIALPFLVMYRPLSHLLSVGLGGVKGCQILSNLKHSYETNTWSGVAKDGGHLCLVVTSVALAVIHPMTGIVLAQTIQGGADLLVLAEHLVDGDLSAAGADLGRLVKRGLYTAATVWISPQLIALSLVAQAAFELIEAQEEWKKGRLPEVVAKIAMVALRTYQTRDELWNLYDEYAYKKVENLQTLRQLIEENKQVDKGLSLQETFKKHAYSSKIVALDLSEVDLSDVILSNLTFRGVNFNWVDFSGKTIENVHFDACRFKNVICFETSFKNTRFSHPDLTDSNFFKTKFDDVYFEACRFKNVICFETSFKNTRFSHSDLTDSNFFKAKFDDVHFSHVNLFGSMWNRSTLKDVSFEHTLFAESNFFLSEHINTRVKTSDLTNAIFADAKEKMHFEGCTEHRFTKPVVALGWECVMPLEWGNKIYHVIKDQGGIAFRFDFSPKVDWDKLDNGMQPIFDKAYAEENGLSIAQKVLAYEMHEPLNQIKADAATIVEYCDGVIIPGGADLHWEFYRNTPTECMTQFSYGPDLYELAIVDAALKNDLPLMGVCRGSQLINVYHGGTLRNVEGHCGCFQKLEFPKNTGDRLVETFHEILGDSFKAFCLHDQGMERLGEGFKLLLDFEGVPKLVVSKNGREILSQFHPEEYIYWDELLDELKEEKKSGFSESDEDSAESWKALYTHFFSLITHP